VVVGEVGGGNRQEHLALGDTPNIAARLQGLAAPNTVVISEATARLVHGYFVCQALGTHAVKGLETPVHVSQVLGESAAQSRLDIAATAGLTPLVGREAEVALLRERWAQSTQGLGQVVLLTGEAGIGKSRLVRVLTERVVTSQVPQPTLRCSPYHTNSALHPVIEHLQRLLHWDLGATAETRLAMLEQALQTAGLPLGEVVPLMAALLSLPIPAHYPPLALTPQRQKQQTLEALVAWLLAETAQQPVLAIWEDLHWADPSTLELLGLLLDQAPTARLLLVLTARPSFRAPWATRSYVTPLAVTRLLGPQVEELALRMTGERALPAEVLRQIAEKTDGIPLFVEELVKTILEAELVREDAGRYVLNGPLPPLAIPTTLQDALMARLDRLAAVKAVAQVASVLGREFSYALLRAVAPMEEATLQHGLAQLSDAELLYRRGRPPQAIYLFKHALVQDVAYQSLLRSTRQRHHQNIAQVLEREFPDVAANQPELLAQHYTEAGLTTLAIANWQRAGERALQGSANVEAIHHLVKGIELLSGLPDTLERDQKELELQLTLGPALMAAKGQAAPEARRAYTRARELGQLKPASPRRSTSPATRGPDPSSSVLPRACRARGYVTASATTLVRCWPRFTTVSPRASTPPTSRRPRCYWLNWWRMTGETVARPHAEHAVSPDGLPRSLGSLALRR
jgi:predicted ATPase